MLGDVVQPQRLGTVDDQPQETVPGRQVADDGGRLAGDAVVDEHPQPLVRPLSEHAERRVSGIHQSTRDGHDPSQDAVQTEVRGHRDDSVEEQPKTFLLVQHSLDPRQHLAQQGVQVGVTQR